MPKTATSLDTYVARSMRTVQGYMTRMDARVIQALLSYQRENGILGHLCEIGVHHGRLFLMLALARRTGERSLAIDLFEDDPINSNTRHAGRNRALSANAQRLGIELSEPEIFKTSSLDVADIDILDRTNGRVRFFSIDGGHLYHHVENDLRLAEKTLTGEGVIAVDDFFTPNWADVTFATYDFLRSTKNIVPIAITSKKLYLAPSPVAEMYTTVLRKCIEIAHISNVRILDMETLALKQRTTERVYEFLRDAIAFRAN